ncbi:hypothetical protein ES703_125740 [subsurface metagenome]
MSESMLKKPKAIGPWLRESKANGIIFLLNENCSILPGPFYRLILMFYVDQAKIMIILMFKVL